MPSWFHCLFQGAGAVHPLVNAVWTLAEDFRTKLPLLASRVTRTCAATTPRRTFSSPVPNSALYSGGCNRVPPTCGSCARRFRQSRRCASFSGTSSKISTGALSTSHAIGLLFRRTTALLALPPVLVATGGCRTLGAGSDANSTTTTNTRSTGVSTLTTTSDPPGERQTRVTNPTPDGEFTALTLKPRLGDLLRLHPPAKQRSRQRTLRLLVGQGCLLLPMPVAAPPIPVSHPQQSALDFSPTSRNTLWWALTSGPGAVVPTAPAPWLTTAPTIPPPCSSFSYSPHRLSADAALPHSSSSSKRPRLHSPPSPQRLRPGQIMTPAQIVNEPHSRTTNLLSEYALGKSACTSAQEFTRLGSWETFVSSLRVTSPTFRPERPPSSPQGRPPSRITCGAGELPFPCGTP
jgi:hypothetical protein